MALEGQNWAKNTIKGKNEDTSKTRHHLKKLYIYTHNFIYYYFESGIYIYITPDFRWVETTNELMGS